MELAPGHRLEKYVLERLLGSGGMGTVWLAHDQELDRRVALKLLRQTLQDDATARARMVREARAMARLRHPNVITVYDAGSADGYEFVVMELVEGENMASWLLGAEHSQDEIVRVLLAAGRGLAAAHDAGMVHRDFKPHNVLVEKGTGRVLVTDFGLVRALDDEGAPNRLTPPKYEEPAPNVTIPGGPSGKRRQPSIPPETNPGSTSKMGALDSPLTKEGFMLGTPAYMAPEQMTGERADARADQFAFCVTAWEALSGSRPFLGNLTIDIARAIHRQEPTAIDKVPRRVRTILRRGLHRDPALRWRSMSHLVGAMARAWSRRTLYMLGAATIVLAAGAVVTVLMMSSDDAPKSSCVGDALTSQRSDLRRKFALPNDDLVAGDLDRWADDWTKSAKANCAVPNAPDFAVRKLCLEGQRDEVASLFTNVDASTLASMRAVEIGLVLPTSESCDRSPRAIAPPLPEDPATRAKVVALRREMMILQLDAKPPATYEQLAPRAAKLVADAAAVGFALVEAEAMETQGAVRYLLAPADDLGAIAAFNEAAQMFAKVAERAEALGYDRLRADAMLDQLRAASSAADHFETVAEMVRRTELAVTRLGDPARDLTLEIIRADIAFQQNLWSEAVERAGRARAAWRKRGGRVMVARTALVEVEARELRHANDDLETANSVLRDTLSLKLSADDREVMEKLADRIAHRQGTAKPISAGDKAGGSIAGAITGIGAGVVADTIDYARRTLPTVVVDGNKQSWTLLADAESKFKLVDVPPGRYTITASVATSAGDIHAVRAIAVVTANEQANVNIDIPMPIGLDTTMLDELEFLDGLVIVLSGSSMPRTPAAFKATFADAKWFTATAYAMNGPAVLARPYTVCLTPGAMFDDDGKLTTDPTAVDCIRGR